MQPYYPCCSLSMGIIGVTAAMSKSSIYVQREMEGGGMEGQMDKEMGKGREREAGKTGKRGEQGIVGGESGMKDEDNEE